jgi:hypothetical protein
MGGRRRNRILLRCPDGFIWWETHPLTACADTPEAARAEYEALVARLAADGLEVAGKLPTPRATDEHANMWAGKCRFGQAEPVGLRLRRHGNGP